MCTSLISNRKKTLVGWNLDILDMEYRVTPSDRGVYIEINDAAEGWLPLFGANSRGDFVAMPTCWPYNGKSNPAPEKKQHILLLDIDLLLEKKTWEEIRDISRTEPIASVPGLTFMGQLTNRAGDVLRLIPGEACQELRRPLFAVLTNFSPHNSGPQIHPWEGRDRYQKAMSMLAGAADDFDVGDCFDILRAVAQQECPTVVSMVFDVTDNTVYWCENQQWDEIRSQRFAAKI